jgi:predicted dehydrogenase
MYIRGVGQGSERMIRIGVIGAGPNGAGHAQYFASHERSRVVAIADPDMKRAIELADSVNARAMSDYREMLGNVDAIVISSPNFLHREHSEACASAGIHIYCEKPMGLSLADAQAIAAAVERSGVKSVVGFAVRFSAAMQTMKKALDDGMLGNLVSLCSRRLMYIDPEQQSGWRRDHRLSGGLLMEINIHELEWMLAFGGRVESVYARMWAAKSSSPRSNDQIWVTLNFANGAVGMHEGSWLSAQPQFYRSIQGADGGLCTDEWGNTVYFAKPGENRDALPPSPDFDLRGHFLDCIEFGTAPVADAQWGLNVMAVAEAVLASANTGSPVSVPG